MEKGGLKMGQEGWNETGKEEEGRSQSVRCFSEMTLIVCVCVC